MECNYESICALKLLFDYLKASIKQAGERSKTKRKNASSLLTATSSTHQYTAFEFPLKCSSMSNLFFIPFPSISRYVTLLMAFMGADLQWALYTRNHFQSNLCKVPPFRFRGVISGSHFHNLRLLLIHSFLITHEIRLSDAGL